MLSVVILNVDKLNVIMLSVVAPFLGPSDTTNIRPVSDKQSCLFSNFVS